MTTTAAEPVSITAALKIAPAELRRWLRWEASRAASFRKPQLTMTFMRARKPSDAALEKDVQLALAAAAALVDAGVTDSLIVADVEHTKATSSATAGIYVLLRDAAEDTAPRGRARD
jgi:hypothetical protein